VVRLYDDLLRQGAGADGVSWLQALMPTAAFANGFLAGVPGLRPVE
jgi:O2-independent ubiquinone biosynthesis protein UbiV